MTEIGQVNAPVNPIDMSTSKFAVVNDPGKLKIALST